MGGAAEAATFNVTNNDDTGAGSLRQAVIDANLTPAADTVTFAPSVVGSIVLGGTEIPITAPIDIQGPGADDLAIDGDEGSRIFGIDGGAVSGTRIPVTISGLTLTGGDDSTGGAISGEFTNFTLSESVVTGNVASSQGGGLYLDSAVVNIVDSEISSNKSTAGGGGLYIDGDNDAANPTTDTVTFTDSVLKNNRADGNGGALYIDNSTGGAALILRSTIAGNRATADGGGIHFYGHRGSSTIRQSTISGNTSDDDGGGFYFDSGYAGVPGPLLVENSTVSGNRADKGGGMYIENSDNEPVTLRNSTIARNSADGSGGGIYRSDFGVALSSAIVGDNSSDTTTQDDLGQAPAATLAFTSGNSLLESSTGVTLTQTPAGSNILGADPALGGLADNGGPTRTLLPADTSPVIDKGVANGLTTDQRGDPRTSGTGTDIGSVELKNTEVIDPAASTKATQTFKKKVVVKLDASAGEAVEITASGSVKAGKDYPLAPVTTDAAANEVKSLSLKPTSSKASKSIAKYLKKKGKKATAKVTVAVSYTDSEGNVATEDLKAKLKLKKKKK